MAKTTPKDQQMPTLAEVRAQLEALKKQEAELLAKEREPIIQQMRENIAAYNITAVELGFTPSMGQKIAKATKKASGEPAVILYKDGENTWSGGRGRKPKWVTEKIAAGEDIEKYKVA
jgi:DNA-binding protein H-NS